jgi:hypothetical protein
VINAEWHGRNRMPRSPTLEQRIAWHTAHQAHCACRPIPTKLLEQMKRADEGSPMTLEGNAARSAARMEGA